MRGVSWQIVAMTKRHSSKVAAVPAAYQSRSFAEIFDEATCAAYIGVRPRTIREFRSRLGLPFLRITSKVVRFKKADVDDWLDRQKIAFPPKSRARSITPAVPPPRSSCKAAARQGGQNG
jgi:hypothetical protein